MTPDQVLRDFLDSHVVLYDRETIPMYDAIDLAKIERDQLITTQLDQQFIYARLTPKGFKTLYEMVPESQKNLTSHKNIRLYG